MTVRVLTLFALICTISFVPTFGELYVPGWFSVVHQYWKSERISDQEFANAISYLQKFSVLTLAESETDAIENFLVTDSLIRQDTLGHSDFSDCSSGWYVTGYFTPVESDYTGRFITVNVDDISYNFREDFVTEIKIEGWGKTASGNYLGWFDESFHLSDFPLDAVGNELVVNAIAVDRSIIPANTKITIPSLPSPWDGMVFTGSDIGPAIIGKHIDVYTGEGNDALDEAYRITGHHNIVCTESK
ncbi:MAG: 3D domain-containing protein [Nitrososphaerota archaeon]